VKSISITGSERDSEPMTAHCRLTDTGDEMSSSTRQKKREKKFLQAGIDAVRTQKHLTAENKSYREQLIKLADELEAAELSRDTARESFETSLKKLEQQELTIRGLRTAEQQAIEETDRLKNALLRSQREKGAIDAERQKLAILDQEAAPLRRRLRETKTLLATAKTEISRLKRKVRKLEQVDDF
jgi:chromosome segregation ATPase